jgi:hypothetical protein
MKYITPIASKTMDATISIYACGTVIIRLPRDAHSWCPNNHTPRFVKNVEGIKFIFDPPHNVEWTHKQSSRKQEEQQELLQELL